MSAINTVHKMAELSSRVDCIQRQSEIMKDQQHSYSHLLGDGASSSSEPIPISPSSCDSLLRLLPACLVPLPLEVLPLPTDLIGNAGLLEAAFAFAFLFLPASHQQAVSFSFQLQLLSVWLLQMKPLGQLHHKIVCFNSHCLKIMLTESCSCL